jgi:hypothetical protein
MRDLALLGVLYGTGEISKVFDIEEKVLLHWIQKLEKDPFFEALRCYIFSKIKQSDPSIVSKKYLLSQKVIKKLIDYDEQPEKISIELDKIVAMSKNAQKEEVGLKKVRKINEVDLVIEDWYLSDEKYLVSTENFLSGINFMAEKPSKKIKLDNREQIMAEVIRDGPHIFKETAIKYGENPRLVQDWVETCKKEGKIKDCTRGIRKASEVLQKAYTTLDDII